MIDPGLAGKVALITGASSGIGAACARMLAAQGALVAIHYLAEAPREHAEFIIAGEARARQTREEIRRAGGRAELVGADLADPASIPRVLDEVEGLLGPVSVLVNNAAHYESPEPLLSLTAGGVDRHFQVNTRAPALLMAEFARRICSRGPRGGRVINISTDAAQAFATATAYGASKAALEALTRSAAIELGPLGITVNAIAAGPVQTGFITAEIERQVLPSIPLGRIGTPEDIAGAAVFLASEQAGWITGQVIRVCGGHVV